MKKAILSQLNAFIRWKADRKRYLAASRRSTASLISLFSLFLLLSACIQIASVPTSHQSNSPGIYVFSGYHKNDSVSPGLSKLDVKTHKLLWYTQPTLFYGAFFGNQQLVVTGDHVYLSFFAFNIKSSKNVIYNASFVYAFSARNGKELWHTESELYKYPGPLGLFGGTWWITPTADNESVYIASTAGKVSALDAKNGSLRWTYDTKVEGIFCGTKGGKCDSMYKDSLAINQLTIAHSIIYGSIKNHFYALDAAKGTLLWSRDLPADQIIEQPVALDGKLAYIAACTTSIDRRACSLNAYTANNGSPVWRIVESHYHLRQLTIWDHKIYGVSQSNTDSFVLGVSAWNSTDGKQLWHYESPKGTVDTLLVANNQVYIEQIGYDHQKHRETCKLLALDATTGIIRWQSSQSYEISVLRAIGDHTLYAFYKDTLFAYKATDGSKHWQYTLAAVSGYQYTIVDIFVIPIAQ